MSRERSNLEAIIGQAIADSFLGMQSGKDEHGTEPNAGDMQLAFDVTKALAAASGGPDHILQMKQGVWTVQHPLHERFGNEPLFDCRYFDLIQIAWGQGAFGRDGNHRLWIDRGVLMWEEIP